LKVNAQRWVPASGEGKVNASDDDHPAHVGRNEDAARLFINSQMIILGTYLIEMLLVGIGGILIAFYTNSISPR
jgi:hypothetical protein